MGTTNIYGWHYPGPGDEPDGASQMQQLAEDAEATLSGIETSKIPTTPIGWTNLTLAGGAADGGNGQSRHRIRRLATGQVEMQIDVDMTGVSTSGTTITTVPSWAIPGAGTMRWAPATPSSSSVLNCHLDISTSTGVVKVWAASWSSLTWMGITVVYTP